MPGLSDQEKESTIDEFVKDISISSKLSLQEESALGLAMRGEQIQ